MRQEKLEVRTGEKFKKPIPDPLAIHFQGHKNPLQRKKLALPCIEIRLGTLRGVAAVSARNSNHPRPVLACPGL